MKCETVNCNNEAKANIQWGKDVDKEKKNLCQRCILDLWDKMNRCVSDHVGMWVEKEPER